MTRFETLIDQHHDEIYRYLWRLVGCRSGADGATGVDDLTQEVFMRAYRAFDRLPAGSNTRAWLYRIATNCAYSALKRSRRMQNTVTLSEETEQLVSAAPMPEQRVAAAETLGTLGEAVRGLPPKQRAALIMRYLDEMAYTEIAKALGCSEDSARANVYQALRRLRRELAEEV